MGLTTGRNGECYRDYDAYIRSWEWRWFAEQMKAAMDYQCERCDIGAPESVLHVHHIHYDSLGKESEEDIEVLCNRCHAEEHGIIPDSHIMDFSTFSMSLSSWD